MLDRQRRVLRPRRVSDAVGHLAADLPRALERWDESDPVLAALARRDPLRPRSERRTSAFASLVVSITHQQVSLAAGQTIHGRVVAACGGRVTPERVLAAGPRRLRAAGLSTSKTAYVLDLAHRCDRRELDFRRLARAPDAEVIEALTAVKGIGVWTAQMFMLFHQGRPDVLAVGDVGLQIAAENLYGKPGRGKQILAAKAAAWSPYGSLASLVLWDSRRRERTPKPRRKT